MDRSDLEAWLAHIEQSRPQHIIELGLERVKEVGAAAKVLDFSCPVITVAGTNGKGSTVAVLATLLQAAGLNVGAYTSPHLLRFNERIQINGQPVSDEALCEAFASIEQHALKGLTFFEYTTLAALAVFHKASPKLDVIILEVGLGGRLDAVNVIAPTLAVFTSISIDHAEILGATREAIAHEKAGILRPNIPVVVSEQAYVSSLQKALQANQNPYVLEGKDFEFSDASYQEWRFQDKVIKLPKCNLPENSVSIALAAYTVFSKSFYQLPDISEVINYIENVTMMGRFQTVQVDGIPVILDVAHNPASCLRLAQRLKQHTDSKVIAVWASLQDKDLSNIVIPMLSRVSEWFIGGLHQVTRSAPPSLLEQTLEAQGAKCLSAYDSLLAAFTAALKRCKAGDHIVVFGSFFTVSSVLRTLVDDQSYRHYGLMRCLY
ncbi:MAG: folylpolyglutamate synthase/dihydrofolate synthase family protein [Candidatus Berkiella sp.]